MIRSFKSKKLKRFWEKGEDRHVSAKDRARVADILAALDSAFVIEDMDVPGWRLHKLEPHSRNRWSVDVDQNWRVTFVVQNGEATEINLEDTH